MNAHLALAAGVLVISFSAIFVRLAGASPATTTFFRAAYALPLLLALRAIRRHEDHRPTVLRRRAALAGLILAGDLTLWHLAIGDIGAGLATVVANVQVLIVGLVAWLVYGERPTRLAAVLVPAVFLGVALISGLGRPEAYGANPPRGVLFGLGAGLSYACFLLVFRSSGRGAASSVGPLTDATLGTAVGALLLGPLADPRFSLAPSWPAHAWLAALALAPQAVGWLLIAAALPRLPALETSVMLLGQPMLTVLWAHLIFGERLASVQWLGVGLVLGGVGVLSLKGSVRKR